MSVLKPEAYRGLFDGTTPWDDEGVTKSLEIMNRIYDYANPDFPSTSWGDINDRFVADNGPAMMLMGDWTRGVLQSKGFADYHWTVAPGTQGLFMVLSDLRPAQERPAPRQRHRLPQSLRLQGGSGRFQPHQGLHPRPHRWRPHQVRRVPAGGDGRFRQRRGRAQHPARRRRQAELLVDYDIALADLAANRDVEKCRGMLVEAAKVAEIMK